VVAASCHALNTQQLLLGRRVASSLAWPVLLHCSNLHVTACPPTAASQTLLCYPAQGEGGARHIRR